MRLNELANKTIKRAVFTFGRLNPPHYGHGGMIDTLQKVARENNADWFLFVSSKSGDEKNPLTYEQKIWWIQALFPETKGHLVVDPTIKTPLVAATWLYKQGYRAATFVAGEDDMSSYGEMIKSGNAHGKKNPDAVKAGKGFIFNPLDFAISPRLASATNARKNVTDGDPEAFVRSILGPKINPNLAALVQNKLYPTLRKSMNLESVNEDFDSDAEERRAFMLRPENQKDTVISKAIKDYTPVGDMIKVGSAINKGDYKAAIIPAASLATNAIPGKPVISMAAGAALGAAQAITNANESEKLNKSTPSVMDLAKKYMTNPAKIHRELAKGVKIEFEHTSDIDIATEIAMDHLNEKLDYYTRLSKAENESEDDDAVAIPGEPVSAAMSRMNARPTDQSKADFLGSYMKSALDQGGFTNGTFAQHTDNLKKKIGENFADGKGPGRPGDSQRHGIPKKATMAELEKASHAEGRKGQLARWQLNMRRGKKKANEEITNEEKKPKKPKTIIDGALKTLIAKGRSEDEAIADLKKEIDSKFYDLDENWSQMELAIMEGGHLLDEHDESLEETLKQVKGKWALVSRHDPKKVLQYYKGSGHPSKEWVSKVERRVHSFESVETKIDDNWFNDGFQTYKQPTPVKYQTANKDGVLQTLEGPVKFKTGYKIITGPKGEQYPIPPEKFASLYDGTEEGVAIPKKIIKVAKLADHDGVVNTSWGEPLNYTAGNDIIVRHGPNDYGVVKKDIFAKTYVKEDYRDAARYAAQAHSGQTRSGGKPYISHPVRVANLVKKYKDSAKLDQLMSAAFLHDTIEDTDTDEEQLRKMFGDLVASLVKELTSDKAKIEKLGKAEYLTQKMIHMSSWGLVIKLADRLDNVADIKTAKTPEWRHRYRAETESILSKLEQNRKLSGTHQNIIAAIRAKLAEIDETISEDNKPLRYDMYSGISFPDGPVYFSNHLSERLVQRKTDLLLVQELLLKARKEYGNKIANYDFDNSFVIKKKSGPGIAVDKKQQPDNSIRYRVRTYHPDKNVGYIQDRVYVSEEVEPVQPLVYIDMDGVLADFFGEWSRISGVDHYKDIDDVPAKLELIRQHPTFWIDLPLLPHAKALIRTVVEQYGGYRICSTPLQGDERSKSGKLEWIKNHLSDMPPKEIILTHDKSQFALNNNQPNILIDDFGKNINAWKSAGGIGIKYEDSNFNSVAKILEKLSKN